jgi:NAD(P)-dependent dehydrogenase (short-subunit alcohol dehydrogenase family)
MRSKVHARVSYRKRFQAGGVIRRSGPALVVGATGGVGAAVAEELASAGFDIALVGRDPQRLADVRAAAAGHGVAVAAYPADIAHRSVPERVVGRVREELGPPSVLVNAAGTFGPLAAFASTDPDSWLDTLAVNLEAPCRFARAVLPAMLERGFGRIVNVSSLAALNPPTALNSAYAASKVALNQWTASLAVELAGTGVTANALHPGDLRTRMWAQIDAAARREGAPAAAFADWAERVRGSGGDDPHEAARQVLAVVDAPGAPNGMFFIVGLLAGAEVTTPAHALTPVRPTD